MKKPVKKFGGGMMRAISEAVKKATGPMAQRAASGPVGGVAQMATEAAPMAAARPQGRGIMGRAAQAAAAAAAKRVKPGGMKKGGVVKKKTTRKK